MFTTLVESRPVRHRSISGTITSVVLHGAAIGAAVGLTVTGTVIANPAPEKPPVVIYTPVKPAETPPIARAPSTPATPSAPQVPTRTIIAPVDIPTNIPPVDFSARPIEENERFVIGPGVPGPSRSVGPVIGGPGSVVDETVVERAPQLIGNAPSPRYPSALRESGIAGRVTLRFVIDTLGRAEMGDVITMEATHPLFADAVKNVLFQYRFRAGEVGGRKVRTLVQMPFVFTLR